MAPEGWVPVSLSHLVLSWWYITLSVSVKLCCMCVVYDALLHTQFIPEHRFELHGPLIRRFFSINVYRPHDPQLVESKDTEGQL